MRWLIISKSRPDESLGVVTLNLKQRDLIYEMVEERLQSVAGADVYRLRPHHETWLEGLDGMAGSLQHFTNRHPRPLLRKQVIQESHFGPIAIGGPV
jgi:hypothetical protein